MPESFRMAQELWASDFATGPSFAVSALALKADTLDPV